MPKMSIAARGKYINYLVLAAIFLPLIFIAEVAYVESQPAKMANQEQTKELAKLRAEAKTAWLSSQAALVRGIANSRAVAVGDPETVNTDFQSFLTAKTGFMALGYAGTDGKIEIDTSGARGQDISGHNYFTEAVAGREFLGQVSGTDWLLSEDVTILAVPVSKQGVVTGVVYGVIRQETVETVLAKLIPGTVIEQQPAGRWLVWLGVAYLLAIIPLVLLVYLLRRQQWLPGATPKVSISQKPGVSQYKPIPVGVNPSVPRRERSISAGAEAVAILEKRLTADGPAAMTPEAIAVRKIAEIVAADTAPETPPAQAMTDTTPAAVIDRVLAVAAYKKVRPARRTSPAIPKELVEPIATAKPEPRREREFIAPAVASQALLPQEKPLTADVTAPAWPVYDTLTNIFTRTAFEKKITAQGGQPDQGIVVLSIDGMKVINDFLNTSAGDSLITITADMLKTVAGPDGTVARIDGDQFAAWLTDISSDRLDDIKKDIKYFIDLHNLRQPELPLSITTGMAMANQGESLIAVWQRANRDMESHKAVNRVEARRFIMWSIKRYCRKA